MARFYAHYQNTTQSGLEAASGDNYYTKRFVNTTNAATAISNIASARSALSSSFYASISATNQNGNSGVVVPADGYTNNGTNVSGSNLYTNSAAIWPADPRVRPTSQILIAGSTAVSPADDFTTTTALYDSARSAVNTYLTGIYTSVALTTLGGPYNRTSLSEWRMLASIWHDHNLTYFAWDDFTPGTPTLNPVQPGSQSASLQLDVTLNWSWEYTNDRRGDIRMNECYLIKTGGGFADYDLKDTSGVTIFNTLRSSSTGTLVARIPGGTLPAGTYQLVWYAQFRDAGITTNFGTEAQYTSSTSFITLT